MAYKPTHLCSEEELLKRRAANRLRNDRYVQNNSLKVRESRRKAGTKYRDNLKNNPEYEEKLIRIKEASRKRSSEWYYNNIEKAKLSSRIYRVKRDRQFPHLAVAKVQNQMARPEG